MNAFRSASSAQRSSFTGSSSSLPPPRVPMATPGKSEIVEAASSLIRGVRESERDRPEAVQPAGALGDIAGEFVVAPRDGCGDKLSVFGVGAVQERRHGHRMGPTPTSSISASRVRGSYWERARGSGVFLPTPLTDGSSRTTPSDDPRQVRQAGTLEPFEQRQRHRMVVHVDRRGDAAPPASAGWLSSDSSACIQFLHVLWFEVHGGRAGTPGLRLLAGWNFDRRALPPLHGEMPDSA